MIKIAWFSVVNWEMTYQDKYLENGVACIFYWNTPISKATLVVYYAFYEILFVGCGI